MSRLILSLVLVQTTVKSLRKQHFLNFAYDLVKRSLEADGYKVWIDLEQMGGSTLGTMAEAVENASVILICLCRKYQESKNCRQGLFYICFFNFAANVKFSFFWSSFAASAAKQSVTKKREN